MNTLENFTGTSTSKGTELSETIEKLNAVDCETTEVLEKATAVLIEDLKTKGYKVDCYSYRRDGKPSGEATQDCEIAIDFRGEGDYNHIDLMVVEENPYAVTENHSDFNLRRAKFVL